MNTARSQQVREELPTRKEFLLTVAGVAGFAAADLVEAATPKPAYGPKVLLVVAHPDDEYAFAATVYRITHELGGVVDQVIITNGEGGYRYSQLAEAIYGVNLTKEEVGRAYLPEIRREETLRAGKILGIRNHFFLKQKDSHFTQDGSEPFQGVWNRKVIAARLDEILARDSYDYVFVLLPTEETHGHHQAAAFLAIEATNRMPEEKRPAVLGGDPAAAGQPQYRFRPRSEFPMFRTRTETPAYSVNRLEKFGPNNTLSYNVVVNWVIAEHKSQGLFQTESDKHATEEFWVLETGRTKPGADPEQLFARLNQVVKQ